jgi:hypothetical protein
MTKDQDFKALVRARMAKTGEAYSTARKHLLAHADAVDVAHGATTTATAISGLTCGHCGEPITDAAGYRLHLERVHGRTQPAITEAGINRVQLCAEFDAAIDDLETALQECPEALWEASMWHVPRTDPWVWPAAGVEPIPERTDESIQQFSSFWVIGYHCLWFLDFYVTANPSGFESPEYVRGGPEEMAWPTDGAAPLATQAFSRDALLAYADHGRRRVRDRIESAADAEFEDRCPPGHPHAGKTLRDLLQVNLAHVREHGSQMLDFVRNR